MSSLYNEKAPKRPTNLTINTDLLTQAKGMKINISSVLEVALANALKQKKREQWLQKNSDAISEYNNQVSKFGLFSDGMRTF
jgi:antitoxin CcdA